MCPLDGTNELALLQNELYTFLWSCWPKFHLNKISCLFIIQQKYTINFPEVVVIRRLVFHVILLTILLWIGTYGCITRQACPVQK